MCHESRVDFNLCRVQNAGFRAFIHRGNVCIDTYFTGCTGHILYSSWHIESENSLCHGRIFKTAKEERRGLSCCSVGEQHARPVSIAKAKENVSAIRRASVCCQHRASVVARLRGRVKGLHSSPPSLFRRSLTQIR